VHRRQFLSRHLALHFLVIVRDFDIFRSRVRPTETDAELIVDPDGVSTLSIAAQLVQSVARRLREVSQRAGRVKHLEFAAARRHEIGREPLLGKISLGDLRRRLSLNDLIATPSRSAANGFYVSNNDTAIKRNASISDTFDGLRRLAPAHSERVTPYSLLRAESGDGVDARAGHGDSGGFAAGSKAP